MDVLHGVDQSNSVFLAPLTQDNRKLNACKKKNENIYQSS